MRLYNFSGSSGIIENPPIEPEIPNELLVKTPTNLNNPITIDDHHNLIAETTSITNQVIFV